MLISKDLLWMVWPIALCLPPKSFSLYIWKRGKYLVYAERKFYWKSDAFAFTGILIAQWILVMYIIYRYLVQWKRWTKHLEAISCVDRSSISFLTYSDSDFSPILSQTLLVFFGHILSGPKAVYVIILPERDDAVCCSVRSPSLNVISQVIVISTNQKLQRLFHCLSKGD